MVGKTMGMVRTSVKSLVFLFLVISVISGCSGGGGGTGGGGGSRGSSSGTSSSDADMQKIADEFKKLGKGQWEITGLERQGDEVNISMKVGDDPGKVTFKEAQAAEEAVHKILPKASGKLSWVSVQGVGLRTVLMEPAEGAPAGEQGMDTGEQHHEEHQAEHQGDHEGGH